MVAELGTPAIYAVLLWWFTTGVILFLDGLHRSTFRWSMGAATGGLLAAAWLLWSSSADTSVRGAYTAFTCAVLCWGWIEMSFLMGFITGSRKHACSARCAGWRHFVHATQAIAYNEIATLLGGVAILIATRHAPNQVALWTYLVLWTMRLSAKLNLFLGVPNRGEKFLPGHLIYLQSFFGKRAMNFLFPFSVSAATVVLVMLVQQYRGSHDAAHAVGHALVGSLLALALLEHWFMVLPFSSVKLWHWALRGGARKPQEVRLT